MEIEKLEQLAQIIRKNLGKEFEEYHLSGNLVRTIKVSKVGDKVYVDIPAETYDMYKYFKTKVVVPTGKGSYANELNINGSFAGHHKGFVQNVIDKSIKEWLALNSLKARVKELK